MANKMKAQAKRGSAMTGKSKVIASSTKGAIPGKGKNVAKAK